MLTFVIIDRDFKASSKIVLSYLTNSREISDVPRPFASLQFNTALIGPTYGLDEDLILIHRFHGIRYSAPGNSVAGDFVFC